MKKGVMLFLTASVGCLAASAAELPLKISVLDNSVLCVRASHLPGDITDQVQTAAATNHLSGTVLDLRFADGAATNAANYFIDRKLPLVVLVNGQTRGTAADLATELRTEAAAVIIGSTNSPANLAPDILVPVSTEDEMKFQDNPLQTSAPGTPPNLSATNDLAAFIDHTSEAELVRKRIKDGEEDGEVNTPRAAPPAPVIRDPALARAMDLLKALAALHPARG